MMEAFGGKGSYVEDPKDLRGALDAAIAFPGPALVNVKLSLRSAAQAAGVPMAQLGFYLTPHPPGLGPGGEEPPGSEVVARRNEAP